MAWLVVTHTHTHTHTQSEETKKGGFPERSTPHAGSAAVCTMCGGTPGYNAAAPHCTWDIRTRIHTHTLGNLVIIWPSFFTGISGHADIVVAGMPNQNAGMVVWWDTKSRCHDWWELGH
eukprot:1161007-Pelagomonas_calceolata.AAC.2